MGALVGLFRGIGGPDIGRDVGRDIGASISEELEKAIEESGKNAQMFLREIFEEGGLGIDRLAEEVGDLFSFLERGEISEKGLLGEMKELLPILIENFDELGQMGKDQIDRIIEAAKQAGVDLGFMGDQLERLQAGIPEMTLEGFARQFDLSEEQKAALSGLGLGIQTDKERAAAELGIPLEMLEGLAPALEKIGISIEELPDFLKAIPGEDMEDLEGLLGSLGLPPELQAQFNEFFASQDPKTIGDATGAAVADHLLPGFRDIMDRSMDKLLIGLRGIVTQET